MICSKCHLSTKNYVPTFCSAYGGKHDFSIGESKAEQSKMNKIAKRITEIKSSNYYKWGWIEDADIREEIRISGKILVSGSYGQL